MTRQTAGIHHVTAIVGDPQENVDFYAGVLGLRFVKKTVNFDDPGTYHLYFGNKKGDPGTIITFFPWSGARRGRIGAGQVGVTTYVVPVGTLGFWEERLKAFGVSVMNSSRFGEDYLEFNDPHGLRLELVAREEGPRNEWAFGNIPQEKAIKGFGGAILYSGNPDSTVHLLEQMGLEKVGEENDFSRLRATGDLGNVIDVKQTIPAPGSMGAGTVHHIAWRARDDEEMKDWRSRIQQNGFSPTEIINREYFHSVYFREEGGILFEMATDPPGFTRDEPLEALGEKLMLPPWLESQRDQIERILQPIEVRLLKGDRRS
ncbi:ring-cleaving dioxygenase [Paludifilum halophilum]|uniref:Ring-cleaving dioxygenase n=1 Tax=Paludifilum halophilum TaxID=1642702 RepID=A0A235B7P7_9BACL|nr:ring-cleaving dioxygenase [Paludifilum halophilum]OYD08252.1 ring-cleaving dioxygenase [Paludifilum halophilum]